MYIAISLIVLSFYWLLYETDYLRIRLLVGELSKPKYARYKAYHLKTGYNDSIHEGNNYPEGYSPNGEPEYSIYLSVGIDNILCGWERLDKHCADLVDYKTQVQMNMGGVRYNMTIKSPSIIKDIMRANHLTKKQKLAYI